MSETRKPIPVILDTDIGDDIDDTWALAMLLKSPEIDLKLAVTDVGNPVYRAKIIAKMLEVAGRTDVPVGLGLWQHDELAGQAGWVADYDLDRYPGTVHRDGVGAIIDTIMNSPEPVTLLCIGPVPNIAEALKREPGIARKARFVGMHGSIRVGYGGSAEPSAEYNVKAYAAACRATFEAPWLEKIITPLDTCGALVLRGERYQSLFDSPDPTLAAVLENYKIWCRHSKHGAYDERSTVLFDTVAAYLTFSTELCVMERMGVRVTGDGFTVEDPDGPAIDVAVDWKDLEGFEEFLVRRLKEPVDSRQ